MKVCQVTSVHSRYDGRIFQKISRSLFANGYDVVLLCIDDKPDEIKDGVKFVHVEHTFKNRIDRILNSSKVLLEKALEIDADIYHLHDPELLPLGAKLSRYGKKVVFDSHEDYANSIEEKEWLPSVVRKTVASLYRQYECKRLSKFSGLISVTPHIVNRLKKINSNTVMVTNYPLLENEIVNDYTSGVVCFAGGISAQWMHDRIIQVLPEFVGAVRYNLIGECSGEYCERLKSLDGIEYVDLPGKMPHADVLKEYSKATAGMALNDYVANVDYHNGSIGNTKVFEYMMAGLPVIGTDFILWKDVIERHGAGICVNPHNLEEIKNAIKRLMNPDYAAECGKNARQAALTEYNWSTQEKILLDFYQSITK